MVLLAVAMRVVVPPAIRLTSLVCIRDPFLISNLIFILFAPLRRALETSARYFPVASQRGQEHWCKHLKWAWKRTKPPQDGLIQNLNVDNDTYMTTF